MLSRHIDEERTNARTIPIAGISRSNWVVAYRGGGKLRRRDHQRTIQDELAEKLGVHPSTICQWERDRKIPHSNSLKKVVASLGMRPTEFIQHEGAFNERQRRILSFFENNLGSTHRLCQDTLDTRADLHRDPNYLLGIGILNREFKGITAYYWVANGQSQHMEKSQHGDRLEGAES